MHIKDQFTENSEKYINNYNIQPTINSDLNKLISSLFNTPENYAFDFVRSFEYNAREWSDRSPNYEDFCNTVNEVDFVILKQKTISTFSQRKNIIIHEPPYLLNNPRFLDLPFYEIIVSSTNTSKIELVEKFLLYKNISTWSILRRDSVSSKTEIDFYGLGFLTYEYCGGWRSKEKIHTRWSLLPVNLNIKIEETGPSLPTLIFAKEAIEKIELKEKFELAFLNIYLKYYYTEYLEMTTEEQETNKNNYPKINSQNEVWQLISEINLIFYKDLKFYVSLSVIFDDDHKLDLFVEDWDFEK